jgi:hypothetical protein
MKYPEKNFTLIAPTDVFSLLSEIDSEVAITFSGYLLQTFGNLPFLSVTCFKE